jgi:deoxyribonuclease-1
MRPTRSTFELGLWLCLSFGLVLGCAPDPDAWAARQIHRLDAAPGPDGGTTEDAAVRADLGREPDAAALPDARVFPDAQMPPDAAPPDLSPPDAAAPMPVDCASWDVVADDGLVAILHAALHEAYRPVEPEVERCGNACRYVAARRSMFTQVERFADDDGEFVVEAAYTGVRASQPADMDPARDAINCEHTWPRSRMSPAEIDEAPAALYSHQQADIHNLLPAVPVVNSTRGSSPFGEVTSPVNTLAPGVVLGDDADGNRVFQPRAERQGDVARIIFYFSVRWGGDIEGFEEDVLRRWSAADPPDAYEARRNDAIEALQGNRNPFIDCPRLVDRVDDFRAFDALDTEENLDFP